MQRQESLRLNRRLESPHDPLAKDPTEDTRGRLPIAPRLDQNVEHVTVLIDGTPEVVQPTPDCHEDLIEMPGVAQATLSSLERAGILGTELETPLPNGLVGDLHAALCQEILYVPEAQREPVVEPDGMADDLGRKSLSPVAGRTLIHGSSLPARRST
jgi:hypothetical protein